MSNFGMSRPGTVDVSSSDVYMEKKLSAILLPAAANHV